MRVVSIDIETTGLDPTIHRVLEVGACVFDTNGGTPPEAWPRFNALLIYPDQEKMPISPYCAKLHTQNGLWDRYANPQEVNRCQVNEFFDRFDVWLTRNSVPRPVTVAGKNFGSFDLQFLKRLPNWNLRLHHRHFDPAVLYYQPGDSVIPDLNLCCVRSGLDYKTNHTAVDDAIFTARLVIEGLKKLPVAI